MSETPKFQPIILRHELARKVIAVAKTRIEGAWAAYIDAVPGENHDNEEDVVLRNGAKLYEPIARALFPREPFKTLPYAP
jgi:hypothetical protein